MNVHVQFVKDVFPAHAGVILSPLRAEEIDCSFPRTRGGDPVYGREETGAAEFSPHTRG